MSKAKKENIIQLSIDRLNQLERTESLFNQILHSTSNAVVIISDNKLVYFNNKLSLLTGYSDNELTSIFFTDIIYSEDKELILENYELTLMNGTQQKSFTFRIVNKMKEIRWMQAKSDRINFQDKKAILFFIIDITERSQAEEAVNTNLNFLNTLIDTIPTPLFYKNTKGAFIGCNTAFAEFLGKTKDEIVGKKANEITTKKLAHEINKLNSELLIKKTRQQYEAKIPHSDGTEHEVIIYNTVFFQPDHTIGGMVGIITDVTERRKAEAALKESERKYMQLLNEAPLGILSCDLDGNIQYVNQILVDLLGSPSKEATLKINMLTFPLLQNVGISGKILECIESNQKVEFESMYKSIWGKNLFFHVILSPIRNIYSEITGVLAILQDVEIRRKSEETIRESERRYRLLAENTLDVIWVKSLEWKNIYVSPSVEKFLGYTVEEYLNLSFDDVLSPKSIEIAKKIIHKFNEKLYSNDEQDKNLKIIQEFEYVRKDKTNIWAEVIISYHRDDLGNIIGIHGITRDISERKRVIKKLKHAIKKAEESDKLKSAFVANMSHELRTPLNAIIGFSDLLVENSITPELQQEYVQYIKNSGKSLLTLINDMLDTASIEAGQIKIVNCEFNLNLLLTELQAYFDNFIKKENKNDIKIILRQGIESDRLIIYADPFRLKQIISNLIGNAIKFTDYGFVEFGYSIIDKPLFPLNLSAQKNKIKDRFIQFHIKDTGIGIPKEKINYIFERFGQLDSTYKRTYGGAGLGLSITKNLVELMGGEIWVESTVSKGTTFYFTLPFHETKNFQFMEEQNEQINIDSFDWSNKTILIAEDGQMNFVLLKKALQKSQITIIWAKNGLEAIQMFKENQQVSIVLMDMQMPELDGYEATKEIKKLNKNIAVVAQTAFAMEGEKEKIIEIGCDGYISKPINRQELIACIAKHIK